CVFFWTERIQLYLFSAVHIALLFQFSFADIQAMRLFLSLAAAGVELVEGTLPFVPLARLGQPIFAWLFVSVSPNSSVSA
ncbi:hypothetical protein KG435_004856, partial [Salmonella enterica subsp. enterica serovar Typhimurium]|nr:hypothetical protein [Salmonella enterica subsp. enterica serovar Typhimurium]